MKRTLDVLLASALLLLLSPLLLAIAIAIRVTSRAPVLFKQERVGRYGSTIRVLKFRSMMPDAEQALARSSELRLTYLANGFTIPASQDPRVTRVGRVLRRTSLDELPQLWNVLRGDMSLVGPRPVLAEEAHLYGDLLWAYLSMRPGITGLWQVSGRNSVSHDHRIRLDAAYCCSQTLWCDLAILVRTPLAVIRGSHPRIDPDRMTDHVRPRTIADLLVRAASTQ